MAVTWPRATLGLGAVGIEVDDARDWLARMSATVLALARLQAGWVARSADLELAMALAERVAEDIDFADLLFKRQYGLRAFPQEMARDSRIIPAWMADLETAPDLLTVLVAVYRVVKPRLLVEFRQYRARTAPNADGPTLRQLDLIEPELAEQITWGVATMTDLAVADSTALVAAVQWTASFEETLVAHGGFFGTTISGDDTLWSRTPPVLSDAPVLRELAALVYTGYDLPWDALLGLAKHLGDVGRHSRRKPQSVTVAEPPPPATTTVERLRRLAGLLDTQAAQVSEEADRFIAATAHVVAAHAWEWAQRLEGVATNGSAGRGQGR